MTPTPSPSGRVPTPHTFDIGAVPWWVYAIIVFAIVLLLALRWAGGDHGPNDGGY